MSIFEHYLTASFRNITFILEDESTKDGRKTVSHEFVNSDKRFVEDLGRIPIIFSIRGFVHGKGNDAGFAERDALRRALNKKGPGQLVHPVYGTVNVTAEPFTVNSSMKEAGKFNFRMVFRTQNSDREPFIQPSRGVFGDTINANQQNLLVTPPVALGQNPSFATASQLAETAQASRDAASSSALDIFEEATDQNYFDTIAETYQEGIAKIRSVTESIESDVVRSLGLTDVERFFKDPPGFLANPEILFPQLSSLYRDISSAGSFNKWVEAAKDFGSLFSLGDDTRRSGRISRSYGALVSNYQMNALINAYQSGVITNFSTVTELEEAEANLNGLFQTVVNDPIDNSVITNVNFPELKTALLDMRSTAKIIFTQKEQNTFKVVSFNSRRRSILQSTYDIYESLDNLTVIANLNQNVNASTPKTPLQVVEV